MREKHKPLRVACYMRVAQAESAEAAQLAMAGQKAVLGDVAEKCGNIGTAYFQDYMNGIQYQRPGLLSVLDAIKCGQADALERRRPLGTRCDKKQGNKRAIATSRRQDNFCR